ncbi:hypothetical protein [Heyndrickxia acidicola]|uniref:Uncharacterized protein n=1 Tax=Heyndrickxia acidicola TaxID=209389 RepID=A0ABU6MMM7_9BACI|nr:hypothetical protein [Heyndrickxia acidicola]MED1205939.1 hypothetical protein [Heyndrickxia acidicola]
MNLFDAKIITTQFGVEIYVDEIKHIQVTDVHLSSPDQPYHECLVGVEYTLLRDKEFYGNRMNYFWIRMTEDFSSLTLVEPETQSLFAVKNDEERQATKMLIEDWLIKTDAFKDSINQLMNDYKNQKDSVVLTQFLEHLLHLHSNDIQTAPVQKLEELA